MQRLSTILIVLALNSFLAVAAEYCPFTKPFHNEPHGANLLHFDLLRRAGSKCANSCAAMGENVCCGKKASCAVDGSGNVACCPYNAVCTGSLDGPAGAGAAKITTGVKAAAAATTSMDDASPPTAAPSGAISHAISGTTTLANSYYPFPVLPTAYANVDECSASFSGCQAESAKCTGFVEGGGYGVTIDGVGGGVTQQGAMSPSSAESICSSLSAAACHGLQLGMCDALAGSSKPTADGNSFVLGKSSTGAAPTQHLAAYGVGVGVALGVMRQVMA